MSQSPRDNRLPEQIPAGRWTDPDVQAFTQQFEDGWDDGVPILIGGKRLDDVLRERRQLPTIYSDES